MPNISLTQKNLVRESFVQLIPRMKTVGPLFYKHLSEISPPAYRMISHLNPHAHQSRIFQMIVLVIGQLDDEAELRFILKDLGKRHKGYGVQPEYYDAFGKALIATMAEAADDGTFTPEVQAAWEAVYAFMVEIAEQVYRSDNEQSA